MPKINQLNSKTVPSNNDEFPIHDPNTGTTRKITRGDLIGGAPLPAGSVDSAALGDTGWVTVPYAAGFSANSTTGPLECRRVSNTVFLRGGVTVDGTSVPISSYTTVATLPAGFRPNKTIYTAAMAAAFRNGGCQTTQLGEVRLGWRDESEPAWISADGISFTVD